VALTEIINEKLTFTLTPGKNSRAAATKTIDTFANTFVDKKAA
jgi:hypothetical protein